MLNVFNSQVRTPVARYGAKVKEVQFYLRLLGPHERYIEVFGGGAAVLLAKHPSKVEVYNDVDSDVVNLFKVLRDPPSAARLKGLLELTPYAREEFENCFNGYAECDDAVEKARRFYVATRQAFQKVPSRNWSYSRTHNMGAFHSSVRLLDAACNRLKNVQIENQDFRKVLMRYDAAEAVYFLDPPYVSGSRVSKKCYRHEMSDDDHKDLLDIICGLKGRVVLCGYSNPLYERALGHWERIENRVACGATMWTGEAKGIRKCPMRTEVAWINRRARLAKTISLPTSPKLVEGGSNLVGTAA